MIPYWLIDNLSVNHLGLYSQIKRATGEYSGGECYLSERTLMKRLKLGKKSLKKSLSFLISRNLINEIGKKGILTNKGVQKVMFYSIVDIWDINTKFYEGAPKRIPLYDKGALKSTQRGMLLRDKEELNKEERIITPEEEEKIKKIKAETWELIKKMKSEGSPNSNDP